MSFTMFTMIPVSAVSLWPTAFKCRFSLTFPVPNKTIQHESTCNVFLFDCDQIYLVILNAVTLSGMSLTGSK